MESTNKSNKVEVVFTKAKISKRLLAYFFDISIWLLTSLIMLTVVNSFVNMSPWHKELSNKEISIKDDSKLYVDGKLIVNYVETSDTFSSLEDKKDFLSNSIDSFYHNERYFSFSSRDSAIEEYNLRKQGAKVNDIYLFKKVAGEIVENDVMPAWLYDFYCEEVNNYCLRYFLQDAEYLDIVRTQFLRGLAEIVGTATIFFIVYFLVLPLTVFKRGRQTIGMKLAKIGLVNINGINVKTSRYILRCVFELFIFVYFNFFSFLVLSIVSITMTFVSKANLSLVNYVFNDYFVSVEKQHIYLTESEMFLSKESINKISIENKDLILK